MLIDAKSGVSGAGRDGGERFSFVNLAENALPYGVGSHRHQPEIEQELRKLGAAGGLTFVPHLVPLDQGLLASCYVELSEPLDEDELRALYAERYAGEPFVELVDAPPGVRDVRETNRCRIHVVSLGERRAGRLRGDRQPLEGRRRPGDPEPQPGARVRRGRGPAVSFFRSRWVSAPDGVEELDPAGLAPGFRAAGVACGIKGNGATDVGIVSCDSTGVDSAILLTANASVAAPVRVCREDCDASSLRAVVVNSGNANAATGEQGYRDALAMRDATAAALALEPGAVAVAETGVIGVPLQIDDVLGGIEAAAKQLSAQGGERFSAAIMTTDKGPKRCTVRAGGVTVSAQAKGRRDDAAGVRDDALLRPDRRRDRRPAGDARRGRRGLVRADHRRRPDEHQRHRRPAGRRRPGQPLPERLLDEVLLQLAIEIVADGEGASRVGRVLVEEAADGTEAEAVARAIANSPLVKTALHGRDPNWGRIAQAAGMALAGLGVGDAGELGPDVIDAEELGRRAARGRDRDSARPRQRRRPRLLLRPHPRVHPDQRRVHDLSRQSSAAMTRRDDAGEKNRAGRGLRRDAARGAALHP